MKMLSKQGKSLSLKQFKKMVKEAENSEMISINESKRRFNQYRENYLKSLK